MKLKTTVSIIAFVIVILAVIWGMIEVQGGDKRAKEECRAKGFECPSTILVKQYEECHNSCLSLDFTKSNLDKSGFGSDECWCSNEGEIPVQIR